jgi:hypothetical protein
MHSANVGVSRADFERNPGAKDVVTVQTKAGLCSCETSNPSVAA